MKAKAQNEKGGVDWEREAARKDEQRKRVVRAFLALRAVKSTSPDAEPAIRRARLQLLTLPHRLAEDLALEDRETIEKILNIEVWNILSEFDARLLEADRAALTPMHARYLVADQELVQGDLLLP